MPRSFAILLAGAVLLQSLLGAFAGAGTVCLGGGHEHPADAETSSCGLDCSHASGGTTLPKPVGEAHENCSCIDIDFSVSEWLASVPRIDSLSLPALLPQPFEVAFTAQGDWQPKQFLPPMPSWFDPGEAQRANHLSTTRLIV